MWLALDVWMCTASILNLCAISLDRYVAVTRPITYPSIMSPSRAKMLIAGLWVLSFVICFPPLVGWKDSQPNGEHNGPMNPVMYPILPTRSCKYGAAANFIIAKKGKVNSSVGKKTCQRIYANSAVSISSDCGLVVIAFCCEYIVTCAAPRPHPPHSRRTIINENERDVLIHTNINIYGRLNTDGCERTSILNSCLCRVLYGEKKTEKNPID
ncbi:hypothetical protein GEV33_008268 [Tenebrio molitor]|uniref:G-protein coupled receptors family 1 profile domain-containing protein n=1 Tax=Tenebrio molitor TaxID=7067 RepID=A0A8J6LCE1_TENMO|nr:hypothetical protein GEV33_008268 [Tenebrio molitor]